MHLESQGQAHQDLFAFDPKSVLGRNPPLGKTEQRVLVFEQGLQANKGQKGFIHFLGGCNKVLQVGWCKTTGICSLIVLEAKSPKSRCWQLHAPSKSSRGGCFLVSSSFWQPWVIFGSWTHHSNLCLSSRGHLPCVCLSVFRWRSLSYKDSSDVG